MKRLLLLGFLFFNVNFMFSQVTGGTSILPGELAWKVGLAGGPSFGFLLGNYKAHCEYLYTDGSGVGFFINAVATYPINYESDIYFTLGYQSMSLSASQEKYRTKYIKGELNPVDVKMQGDADLTLSIINLEVFYKRKFILPELYFLVGLGGNINLSSDIEENETIKDDRFVFDLSNKTSDLIYKGDLPNKNSLGFSGRIGLGYDILIKNKYIIAPQIIFSYPFTNLSSRDTWKAMYLNIGLQFLYIF